MQAISMRLRRQSSAPGPEEVGKQIAREHKVLHQATLKKSGDARREQLRIVNTALQVRDSLRRAVDAYNDHVPPQLHLAIVDKTDRLVFSSSGAFTLTLTYGVDRFILEGSGRHSSRLSAMVIDVWREKTGLFFRSIPDMPVFPAPILTEDQFIYSILRLACDCPFEDRN